MGELQRRVQAGDPTPPEDIEALRKLSIVGERHYILITVPTRALAGEPGPADVHTSMDGPDLAAVVRDFAALLTPGAKP